MGKRGWYTLTDEDKTLLSLAYGRIGLCRPCFGEGVTKVGGGVARHIKTQCNICGGKGWRVYEKASH